MSAQLCVQATIHGRVQGVGFRTWATGNAKKRGLTGWVRNRTDGTVEAIFCGEESEVEQMLAECEQGPAAAKVEKIERKMPDVPPPTDFKQLPTE